jgi:SpoVK/Ycf46/Vps4 family AAA+-type ATPase
MNSTTIPQSPMPPSSKKRPLDKTETTTEDKAGPEGSPKKSCLPKNRTYTLSNGKSLEWDLTLSKRFYDHYRINIETIEDMIALDDFYIKSVNKKNSSNIDFYRIHRLRHPLLQLQDLVGLKEAKQKLLSLVIYYLQKLDRRLETEEENVNLYERDMLHTVVYGGPGTGKTTYIEVLAKIYAALGILKSAKVSYVKRSDLIGQYLGHTAVKTRKAIEEAFGGVLVIDEAYSLGDTEQRDSFSRECIDTLNQYLTEARDKFICVIAGYKSDLDKRFFKSNPGLERRFPFRIEIPDYKDEELREIFLKLVHRNGWKADEQSINVELFKKNKEAFKFNGGDMELLFTNIKFSHGMRVFGESKDSKKTITKEDFEKGLETFLSTDNVKERLGLDDTFDFVKHLYV